jgi:hypothetical protein
MCDAFDILEQRKARQKTVGLPESLRGKSRLFVDFSIAEDQNLALEKQQAVEQDDAKRAVNKTKTQSERMGGRYVATIVDGDAEVFGQPGQAVKEGSGNIDVPETLILRAQARDMENHLEMIQEESKGTSANKNLGLLKLIQVSRGDVVDRPATTVDLTKIRPTRNIEYQVGVSDEEFCKRVYNEATEDVCDF